MEQNLPPQPLEGNKLAYTSISDSSAAQFVVLCYDSLGNECSNFSGSGK